MARRIDHITTDDFRLLAAVQRERGDLQVGPMAAQNPAIAFEEPLGRTHPVRRGRLSAGEPRANMRRNRSRVVLLLLFDGAARCISSRDSTLPVWVRPVPLTST